MVNVKDILNEVMSFFRETKETRLLYIIKSHLSFIAFFLRLADAGFFRAVYLISLSFSELFSNLGQEFLSFLKNAFSL